MTFAGSNPVVTLKIARAASSRALTWLCGSQGCLPSHRPRRAPISGLAARPSDTGRSSRARCSGSRTPSNGSPPCCPMRLQPHRRRAPTPSTLTPRTCPADSQRCRPECSALGPPLAFPPPIPSKASKLQRPRGGSGGRTRGRVRIAPGRTPSPRAAVLRPAWPSQPACPPPWTALASPWRRREACEAAAFGLLALDVVDRLALRTRARKARGVIALPGIQAHRMLVRRNALIEFFQVEVRHGFARVELGPPAARAGADAGVKRESDRARQRRAMRGDAARARTGWRGVLWVEADPELGVADGLLEVLAHRVGGAAIAVRELVSRVRVDGSRVVVNRVLVRAELVQLVALRVKGGDATWYGRRSRARGASDRERRRGVVACARGPRNVR